MSDNTYLPDAQGRRVVGKGKGRATQGSGSPSQFLAMENRPLFPITTTRRLVYHESVYFSSTTGVPGTYVFSTNGLYDPNITGTGHQPSGFDQIMLFYEHYAVRRATMTAVVRSATASVFPTVVLTVNAGPTAITDPDELQEDGSSVRTKLAGSGQEGQMATLRTSVNIAKFGGVRSLRDSSVYQGAIASMPAEQSYFHLSFFDDEASATCNLYADVTIEYDSIFLEPRSVAPSLQRQIDSLIRSSLQVEEKLPSKPPLLRKVR